MRIHPKLIAAGICVLFAVAGQAQVQAPEPPANPPSASTASTAEQAPDAQAAPTPDASQQQAAEAPQRKTSEEILNEAKKQKMLGVVPMYGVTNYQYAPALTPGQKFDLMIRSYASPFPYLAAGLQAGFGQATNNFEAYGQGASGYGKRFGAALTDGFDSNFFSNYFYPVLFKQDPRYFRLGEGRITKRIGYALVQVFVSKKDSDRRRTFSYSNVLGAFTAGTISNAYYPQDERGVGLTVSRSAVSFAWGGVSNLMLEFWPDISKGLSHKRKPDDVPIK